MTDICTAECDLTLRRSPILHPQAPCPYCTYRFVFLLSLILGPFSLRHDISVSRKLDDYRRREAEEVERWIWRGRARVDLRCGKRALPRSGRPRSPHMYPSISPPIFPTTSSCSFSVLFPTPTESGDVNPSYRHVPFMGVVSIYREIDPLGRLKDDIERDLWSHAADNEEVCSAREEWKGFCGEGRILP